MTRMAAEISIGFGYVRVNKVKHASMNKLPTTLRCLLVLDEHRRKNIPTKKRVTETTTVMTASNVFMTTADAFERVAALGRRVYASRQTKGV